MKSSMRSLTRLILALLLDPTSYFFSAGMKANNSRHKVKWPSNMFSSAQQSPEDFLEFSRVFLIQAISLFKRLSAVLRGMFDADANASCGNTRHFSFRSCLSCGKNWESEYQTYVRHPDTQFIKIISKSLTMYASP